MRRSRRSQGFLKSTGLKLDDLTVQDDKKGKFYIARHRASRAAPRGRGHRRDRARYRAQISLAQIHALGLGRICAGCGRCNRSCAPSTARSFPSRSTASPSGNVTRGHRFLAPGEITVRRFEDYAQKLHDAKVVVDAARARRDHPRRGEESRFRARPRTDRGRGAAEGDRRPRRMAGGADGRLRSRNSSTCRRK